jgi:hypothetical protein
MNRISRITRYREQALDRAALIAALSSAHHDAAELNEFADRQDSQLQELVHEFAFGARKLVELVGREKLASAQYAERRTVTCTRSGPGPDDHDASTLSLREVLGRIIHSDVFEIQRAHVPQADGMPSPQPTAWGFDVASDKDPAGVSLFVFIEFMLTEFLTFDRLLRDELARHG